MLNVSNLPDFETTRSLSKDAFVARHSCLFLMFAARAGTAHLGFKTTVAHLDEIAEHAEHGDEDLDAVADAEILALQKAPGNPYSERISLGRARNCDLVVRDASVSKLHAHFLAFSGGGFQLADLESQNGTLLNGKPLVPNVAVPVAVGDALRFGGVVAHLVDAARLYDLMQFAE